MLTLWLFATILSIPMVIAAIIYTFYERITHFFWFARERRRFATGRVARLARGLCPACSYDLTGNVSGTCPECGERLPPKYRMPPRPQ
jgi:hypothetical protein